MKVSFRYNKIYVLNYKSYHDAKNYEAPNKCYFVGILVGIFTKRISVDQT